MDHVVVVAAFVVGGSLGFLTAAMFAARAYDRGHADGMAARYRR